MKRYKMFVKKWRGSRLGLNSQKGKSIKMWMNRIHRRMTKKLIKINERKV